MKRKNKSNINILKGGGANANFTKINITRNQSGNLSRHSNRNTISRKVLPKENALVKFLTNGEIGSKEILSKRLNHDDFDDFFTNYYLHNPNSTRLISKFREFITNEACTVSYHVNRSKKNTSNKSKSSGRNSIRKTSVSVASASVSASERPDFTPIFQRESAQKTYVTIFIGKFSEYIENKYNINLNKAYSDKRKKDRFSYQSTYADMFYILKFYYDNLQKLNTVFNLPNITGINIVDIANLYSRKYPLATFNDIKTAAFKYIDNYPTEVILLIKHHRDDDNNIDDDFFELSNNLVIINVNCIAGGCERDDFLMILLYETLITSGKKYCIQSEDKFNWYANNSSIIRKDDIIVLDASVPLNNQ
jgi:hypothetical protein